MSKKSREERRKRFQQRQKERVDNRDKQTGGIGVLNLSEFEDVSFFSPQKGNTYEIDIIPYIIEGNNHPQGLESGDQDYVLDHWVHYGVGPQEKRFLCLDKTFGKRCPICEMVAKLWKEKDPDKDLIQSIKAKHRVVYNVIDLNDEDKGTQLFAVSYFLFEKELLEEAYEAGDGDTITFADLEDGKIVSFRAVKGTSGDWVAFKKFDFVDRDEKYNEDILDSVYPLDMLLVIPTYDEVENAYLGIEDEEEEKEEEKEETEIPDDQEQAEEVETEEEAKEIETDEEEEQVAVDFDSMKGSELKTYIVNNNLDIKDYKKMKPKELRQAVKDFVSEEEEVETEKETADADNECPSGHKFAHEFEDHKKDCDDCDAWSKCAEAYDDLE